MAGEKKKRKENKWLYYQGVTFIINTIKYYFHTQNVWKKSLTKWQISAEFDNSE